MIPSVYTADNYKHKMISSVLLPLLVLVFAGGTIAMDAFMRGGYRSGFANGMALGGAALAGMVWWFSSHAMDGSQTSSMIALSFFLVMLIANLMIDTANISDQQSGRISKWGSWWDDWNDNYFSNIFDSGVTYFWIFLVVGLMIVTLMRQRAFPDSPTASSAPKVAALTERAKTPTVAAHRHHATHVHGRVKKHPEN